MSATIELVNELEYEDRGTDLITNPDGDSDRTWLDETRWTTKQVIATCLWSALFGLGCGYAWHLLQIGTTGW